MEAFDLITIITVAALAAALIAGAVLHSRFLKRTVLAAGARHVRGLRKYRH